MVAAFHPKVGFRKPQQVNEMTPVGAPLRYARGLFNAVTARNGGKGTVAWASPCDGRRETFRPVWSANLDWREGPSKPTRVPSAACPHSDISLSENADGMAVLAINGRGFGFSVRIAVRPVGRSRFREAIQVSPTNLRVSFAEVVANHDGSATVVAPVTDNLGAAGIVALDFRRTERIDFERDQIAPRASAKPVVGTNGDGRIAVLSQNVDSRMWDFTYRSRVGDFFDSVQLPFDTFTNMPDLTLLPSDVAVGANGQTVAASARAHWISRGHDGFKGIDVYSSLPD